jgi:uncharacterized membrane protein YidH (DUF202 family)
MSKKKHAKRFLSSIKKAVKPTKIGIEEKKMLLLEEQTLLAKERTVLSFMRTGLAMLGAGVVLINIFPDFVMILVMGWLFIIGGIIEIAEAYRRLTKLQDEMDCIKEREVKGI